MPYSYAVYTGNGATTQFTVPFPYIRREHVVVSLNYVSTAFTWVNNTTVQVSPAPANAVRVEVRRVTPVNSPLVDFTDGSTLVAADLDTNALQQTYINQEQDDQIQQGIYVDANGNLTAGNQVLKDLLDPVAAQDAATKNYVDTQDALKVSKAGDTMTGPLAMSGQKITGLGDPTNAQDATTKNWVETATTSPLVQFRSIFYGALASDPAVDPYGNARTEGDLYFNSTLDQMRVFNGTSWQEASADATITRFKFTAAGGETSLSGADDNAEVLTYNVGLELVYLNGALLTRGVDYVATTGSSITGLVALSAADLVEVVAFSQINAVGSIPGANIADGTITTGKLADSSVTTGKLNDSSITTGKLADSSVTTGKLNDLSVTTGKLADSSVTSGKIADGTIVNADVNASAGIVATKLSFTQAGTGAVARTVDSMLKDVVSVKDFGASSAASAAANLTAFKNAVAATPTGGKLFVPADSSFYLIDTTGGLSTAIDINKRMEVVFEGDVKANFSALQANPPYIFNVTAAGVTFSGSGRLIGDGTIDDTNAGNQTNTPGLVYVTGNNFSMTGLTVDTPPKTGVMLFNCVGAKIFGNTFTGGPSAYTTGNTAYFAIYAYQGRGHNLSGNSFVPSATGGMYVNCIYFVGGTSNSLIENNYCEKPYEKLTYLFGDYNTITGNMVYGNTGTIPGTSPAQAGTLTSVYRVNGSFNKISNNFSHYCAAGATVINGSHNEITDNSFIDCGQWGVTVFAVSDSTVMTHNAVRGNKITGAVLTGHTRAGGVYFYADQATMNYGDISENKISSFPSTTAGGIYAVAVSPYSMSDFKISDNHMITVGNGVFTGRMVFSYISNNKILSAVNFAFVETGGASNKWTDNYARSVGTVGISGYAATSDASGNQYTDKPLSGVATCSAAITTTVTHGGVAPNARIFLQTANNAAGLMIVSKGWPTTAVSGTNFTIAMANGTAAAATESFHYTIVQ